MKEINARQLAELIWNDNDHATSYGLRACYESSAPGEILPCSKDWDYEMDIASENDLPGSCTLDLGDGYANEPSELIDTDIARLEWAIARIMDYPGDHIYLVKGRGMMYGNDDHEVVLSSNGGTSGAEVVAKL